MLSKTNLNEVVVWIGGKEKAAQKVPRTVSETATEDWGVWQDCLKQKYDSLFKQEDVMLIEKKQPDHFSQEIADNFSTKCQTIETTRKKLDLWQELANVLERELEVKLAPFGSSFNLLGVKDCDIDLGIYPTPYVERSKLEILQAALGILTRENLIM